MQGQETDEPATEQQRDVQTEDKEPRAVHDPRQNAAAEAFFEMQRCAMGFT